MGICIRIKKIHKDLLFEDSGGMNKHIIPSKAPKKIYTYNILDDLDKNILVDLLSLRR